MPDIADSHTGRSDHVSFNTVAQEQRWSEQLTVYSRSWPEAAGEEKACPASPAPMAGGGIFPVDPAVPRGPGRCAHPHGSGQLARISTPSGVSPRPAIPRSGRRSLFPPFQGAFRSLGTSRRIRGALRAFSCHSPCRTPPACAPRLNRANAVVRLGGFPWRRGVAQGAFRAFGSKGR